jgi:hypothetical protein
MIDIGSLIIGHLAGDYILQNDWMALNKKKPGLEGTLPCLVHCTLYAIAVSLLTNQSWIMFCVAFFAHYPLDRSDLVENWMQLIGTTTFKTAELIEDMSVQQMRKLFIPLVYVGIDNAFHLACMLSMIRLLGI